VFGFAVTLLVVSLAVPKSFDDLLSSLSGIPAFAASFALLAYIWYAQYAFFRNYDFEDAWVVVLNLVLLFVVLVYVYPLKFLYAAVFNPSQAVMRPEQTPCCSSSTAWASRRSSHCSCSSTCTHIARA
jgi:4-amino-4-deoxy-L-arabinose transferase-like glycosyltransferase